MFVVRLLRRGTGWIVVLLALVAAPLLFTYTSASFAAMQQAKKASQQVTAKVAPGKILLDSRLPVQTFGQQAGFANENAKFGSRLNFTVLPHYGVVRSGTDGVFHENEASYIVGMSPSALAQSGGSAQAAGQVGQSKTFIFHMGKANQSLGDSYVSNERWIQALDTTRWMGDAPDGEGMHMTVDIIDTFRGEPGCTAISNCTEAVKDDTVPIFMIGVSLQNTSQQTHQGDFVFGSNRAATSDTACTSQTTGQGTPVNVLSYDASGDVAGGTLFMAGDATHWRCDTKQSDRAGLNWHYSIEAGRTQTSYFVLGGWNASQQLFVNTQLSPATCQSEGLYAAQEWSSQRDVINFAIDNLSAQDNLLGQAQAMENYLINNSVLTPEQRWLIGTTLRSYKASSWLLGRQACAGGGGYDAAVYEGSYGFLTTVDVMHEYGYFEITRVPWFFKSALTSVFNNATSNNFGLYFQHDQGGDVDASGNCTDPGQGTPTLRATCYAPPLVNMGVPMPTEENDNVVLLMAYYEFVTGDSAFLRQHIMQLDAAMIHNINVGDPNTGIAYNGQDTNTTYDAASDCLHNDAPTAGNLYYQGLKEATGYRAAAYLDSLIVGNGHGSVWAQAATKIENAMVQAYNSRGYLPIADSSAFTNCAGRTVALGESLFYLHLIGRDGTMNQTLLSDLATQYPHDLQDNTLSKPAMITMTSTAATGSQCDSGHCRRYEWFSKVMLSGLVADLVYTHHGCSTCTRVDVVQAAYLYNLNFGKSFGDGLHDDTSDWSGHSYPRGIISWAFLSIAY